MKAGQSAGEVGPIIDNIAKERVLKYINEAEASGAKILLDGRTWSSKTPGVIPFSSSFDLKIDFFYKFYIYINEKKKLFL